MTELQMEMLNWDVLSLCISGCKCSLHGNCLWSATQCNIGMVDHKTINTQ